MITLNGALEQYCCHNYNFDRTQIILYFGCTNNIFTKYTLKLQLYGVKCKLYIPYIYISYNPLRCTRLWCNSKKNLIQMPSPFIPFEYLSLEVGRKGKRKNVRSYKCKLDLVWPQNLYSLFSKNIQNTCLKYDKNHNNICKYNISFYTIKT